MYTKFMQLLTLEITTSRFLFEHLLT
jgi:hypothetical protein